VRGAFPGGSSGKEAACHTGDVRDTGSIPEWGWSPGGGHGDSLQYSCLENPNGQRSLAGHTVHRMAQSRTRLKLLNTQLLFISLNLKSTF